MAGRAHLPHLDRSSLCNAVSLEATWHDVGHLSSCYPTDEPHGMGQIVRACSLQSLPSRCRIHVMLAACHCLQLVIVCKIFAHLPRTRLSLFFFFIISMLMPLAKLAQRFRGMY